MREAEKSRKVLEACLGNKGASASECFARAFGGIPAPLREDLANLFVEKNGFDRAKALEWAGTLATILGGDYDDGLFSLQEWKELSGLISEYAGELDMGLVTYVMSLVVERGAI